MAWAVQGVMPVSELEQEDFAGIICLEDAGGAISTGAHKTGQELWRSDGTFEGTFRLDDVYEGSAGSFPQVSERLEGLNKAVAH